MSKTPLCAAATVRAWIFIAVAAVTTATCPSGSFAAADDNWSDADAILKRIVSPTFPAKDFLITDFGAVDDGTTDCRAAIDHAIQACTTAGGGRVVAPKGVYFCDGPIHLANNVDLHIAEGAKIRFGSEPAGYLPVVLTRYEGTMLYSYSARIYARGATNVAITGRGVIDGNGLETLALMRNSKARGGSGELRRMGAEGVPVEERIFGEGKWLRPSLIEPFECTNVLIEGVTVVNSAFWVVHPTLCRNVTVRGIHVDSMNGNNDGCDPDSCADVLIEDCEFNTGDDCIAIKSGRDQDGRTVARPSENIVVRRCNMTSRHGGLCIGSEMSGGARNVFLEDCRMTSVSVALLFKGNLDRGGLVEHVRARHITADHVRFAGIQFQTSYQGYRGGNSPPEYRDFDLEDVAVKESAEYGLFLEGAAGVPVRDVVIRRATIEKAPKGCFFRDLADVRLESVVINGDELPVSPPESPVQKAE